MSRQEISCSTEDIVALQIPNVVEENGNMIQSTKDGVEYKNQYFSNGNYNYNFHDWWTLGKHLNRSIISNDVDMSLLDTLHQQLE
jgi:hypothetical protein